MTWANWMHSELVRRIAMPVAICIGAGVIMVLWYLSEPNDTEAATERGVNPHRLPEKVAQQGQGEKAVGNGGAVGRARSASQWIHWRSSITSAKALMRSCVR